MTALLQVIRNTMIAMTVVAVTTTAWATKRTAPPGEEMTYERAKRLAVIDFKDPDSAKFKDLVKVKKTNGESGVCGRVNTKNSYGGYVGFERFAVILFPDTPLPLPLVPEKNESYSKKLVEYFCDTTDSYEEVKKNALKDAMRDASR